MSKFLIIILFKQKKNVKHTHTQTHTPHAHKIHTHAPLTHNKTFDRNRNSL